MHYQSLYRRYRPQRFGDVLGQEHVSETLRKAVATEKVAHAYLFSGPRGCGKTTSARILAKALNCTNPIDGEPCGECESCAQVTSGASMDVIELDAASNNGVDAMRDLVSRAALGTAGRRKVYIVDEVHMLSTAASNALLKTLEEPPDHVVFVLATTDPQKVLPTIKSRTQHFEFRLFPFQKLLELVRSVAVDAGILLDDATLEAVTRRGNGSARDALSALDQVAAAGGIDDSFDVSELALALGQRDASEVLLAVDRSVERGRDPRQLARDLIESIRSVFLHHMGRPTHPDPGLAKSFTPASATRALEAIGTALVDMRDSLDPRVVLEVALLRLCRRDLDVSPSALLERIEALEAGSPGPVAWAAPAFPAHTPPARPSAPEPPPAPPVGPSSDAPTTGAPSGDALTAAPDSAPPTASAPTTSAPTTSAPTPSAPTAAASPPAPTPSSTSGLPPLQTRGSTSAPSPAPKRGGAADSARAALGNRGSQRSPGSTPRQPAANLGPGPVPAPAPKLTAVPEVPASPTDDLHTRVLAAVSNRARALLAAGRFESVDGDILRFVLPNPAHLQRVEGFTDELSAAASKTLGRSVRVAMSAGNDFASEGHATDDTPDDAPTQRPRPAPVAVQPPVATHHPPEDDGDVDLGALVDAPDNALPTFVDTVTSVFPGAQIVEP